MKILQPLLIVAGLILFAGCKKYLSEEPKKQASIKTVEQLEALVDNATFFAFETNYTATYSTDDTEISKDLYKNNQSVFSTDNMQYYVNSINGIVGAASDGLWNGEYEKIFTANLVLSTVDGVSGSEAMKKSVKADAFFIRAYSYWLLANYYCAPYSDANLNSLGLPLKKTVDYTESLKRATLKETYDFILSDITAAQQLSSDDVNPLKRWRVSKKAIAAFMSRFYLFTGNYDQSLEQANVALSTNNAKLVDYQTLLPGITATYNSPDAKLFFVEQNDWRPVSFLAWPESYYTRYTYTGSLWYMPSEKLLALYDKDHDLRYKSFMIPNGGRRFSVITPSAFRYTIFNDGRYIPEGPTFSEVLLNKAEVLARKGLSGQAMDALNLLRAKRVTNYAPLTATDKDDAIKKVLDERRREMPFSMRWYDIRRFSVNDYAADNVTVTRDFFEVNTGSVDVNTPKTYNLDIKRLLVPINGVEIDASKGQIQQNPY